MAKKAVCLLSGGLDSCVTLFLAKKQGYQLYALSFDYGQIHKKELICAKKIAAAAQVKKHIIFPLNLKRFGGSSLVDPSLQIPMDKTLKTIGKRIPSTYVPARNTIFLSLALAYAETIDANAIFIGAHATDYSGYPDCRPEFFESFQTMVDHATKKTVEHKSIRICTPVLHLSKTEIIKTGITLGVPFEHTWSCYAGKAKACGRCESCLLRLQGFQDAGRNDPVPYASYPAWYKKKLVTAEAHCSSSSSFL